MKTKLPFKGNIIFNATSSLFFEDSLGLQHKVNVDTKNSFIEIKQDILEEKKDYVVLRLKLKNISKSPILLKEVNVLDISCENGGMVNFGDLPFFWTILGRGMSVFPPGGVFDLCNQIGDFAKREFYMADYAVIGNKKNDKYITLGFLSFSKQHGVIKLKVDQDIYNFEYLKAICEFDGYQLDPGEEIETEPLYVNLINEPKPALDKYVNLVLKRIGNKGPFKDIAGWGTWDYYHATITEKEVLKNVRWLARHKNELPIEYIQLDHGFESREGDWLETNNKFPHGLKWLANEIKRYGFKAGIWLCPFLVAKDSKVFKEHPDWVIRDRSGTPVTVFGYTVSHVYILDCSIREVQNWVRELGKAVTREYGFDYIKLDGANVQPMAKAGVLADKKMTKAQAMRIGLEKFREGIGDETILLNACLFGLSIGIVNAMRIGSDVGARWDITNLDAHHGEIDNYPGSGDIYHALISTINSFFIHKKFWINDPDYLIARQKGSHSELTYEEAKSWVSVVGLSNGLIMLSDRMPELKNDRYELLKKVLPHYKRGAEAVGFFEQENPHLFHLKVENGTDKWHVICVINIDIPKRERDYVLNFKELGLDNKKQYHLFDFWEKSYLGSFSKSVNIWKLKPHHCKVLCLKERKNTPQVISTDIHITQGGIEIISSAYNKEEKELVIKTNRINKTGHIYFYVPKRYRIKDGMVKQISKNIYQVKADLNGRDIFIGFNL